MTDTTAGEGVGHIHTAIMNAIKADLECQFPDAFTEDSDCDLIIPSGVTPQTAYVKIDVSALAEAAMPSLAVLSRARAFIDACATEGELTPNDNAENPCDLVNAIDQALAAQPSAGAQGEETALLRNLIKKVVRAAYAAGHDKKPFGVEDAADTIIAKVSATPAQSDTVNVAALLSIPGNTGSRALGRESSRFDGES